MAEKEYRHVGFVARLEKGVEHIPSDLAGLTRKGYIGNKGFDFASAISQLTALALPIANVRNDPQGPQVDYKAENAHVLLGRKNCYLAGMKLAKGARHALYSILSYPEEANGVEQKQMCGAIIEAIKKPGLNDIKRWIDFKNPDFLSQARRLKAEAIKVNKWKTRGASPFQMIQTDCKYVEAMVSDDTVLLVFPDYESKKPVTSDDQVGFGVRVRHPELASRLKLWCLNLVGVKQFKKGVAHNQFLPNNLPHTKSVAPRRKPGKTLSRRRRRRAP